MGNGEGFYPDPFKLKTILEGLATLYRQARATRYLFPGSRPGIDRYFIPSYQYI
jgi:hypothetical protein